MRNNIEHISQQMVAVRHHLHQHPELSFQEYATCAYIEEILHKNNIYCQRVATTGLIVVVSSENECGGDILIRADIDALPIMEATGYDYSSVNEAMHACGHDIHTSVLIGVLIYLSQNRDKFSGRVVAVFEPGEEQSPGGASMIIKEGVLDSFNIVKAFALHTAHDISVGRFGARRGEYMASTSEMHITVKGIGGHAALPKGIINPILISSQLILALKALEDKYENVIIAIGRVHADGATNVIPSEVTLSGTVRAMTMQRKIEIQNYINLISKSLDGNIKLTFTDGYPPVYNDEQLYDESIALLSEKFGREAIDDLGLRMTADDFGFFAQSYPSFYYRLGVKGSWDGLYSPHTPQFRADDAAICYGIESLITLLGVKNL